MPVAANAQAFGLRADMSLNDLQVIEQNTVNSYWVDVPQPNENFDRYLVTATSAGVCTVIASNMNASSFIDLKQVLDPVLRRTYGEPTREHESASLWEGLQGPVEAIFLAAYPDGLLLSYSFPGAAECAAARSVVDATGL
jgi:hypothetical protein